MPLDFLKRKPSADSSQPAAPAQPTGRGPVLMPEEVVAQDFQLKLYYAGKTSEGVRMQTGTGAMDELPSMLTGLARTEIEIVEPLPIEFSQATPTIARPSEAMQWLNAHHVHSPITRSSSWVRGTRPSLVASVGSSARSIRPMARIIRLKMESALAPITTNRPSPHQWP